MSIGFAAFPLAPTLPGALDWEDTVGLADAALLAVKRRRRGHWLGLVSAHADTPEALLGLVRRPAEDWATLPGLVVAASAPIDDAAPVGAGHGPGAPAADAPTPPPTDGDEDAV